MISPRIREQDAQLVHAAMRALGREEHRVTPPLPDPAFIWWKAQLLRRWDAEQEALSPIAVGDYIHFAMAVVGAVVLAVLGWHQLQAAALHGSAVIAALGAFAALLVAVAVTAWNEITGR